MTGLVLPTGPEDTLEPRERTMTSSAVTTRGLGGALVLPGLADLPVTVLLRHRADEPALVRMVVVLGPDESVELAVDRGLLTAGLWAPVVDGDVQVATTGSQVRVTVGDLALVLAGSDVVDLLLASHPTAAGDHVIVLVGPATELSRA